MKIVYRLLFVLLISMFLFGCGDKTSGIEGKIVDGNGKPLPGVSVIFKQVQPMQGYEQFETKTGADGVFKLSGFAPSSEYTITPMSDKWKSKVTKKVKTLEAGQNLTLSPPIKIRFQHNVKDGTIIDTKTGLQWKIYPVKDMTAATVLNKIKGLNEGGFSDWRLPSRADLASLADEKAPSKTPGGEAVPVVKTCCAWVVEPNSEDVDWKFYVEEDNELWASSKETPDNRVVIVRTFTPSSVAAGPAEVKPAEATPAPSTTAVPADVKTADTTPAAPSTAVAPAAGAAEQKAQAAVTAPTAIEAKTDMAKVIDKASTPKQEPAKTPAAPAKKAEPVKTTQPEKSALHETLLFDLGSSKLSAQELVKLKTFYSKIKADKGTILIDGHSDASAAQKATVSNLLLSIERSSNVAVALNKMGLGKETKLEIRAVGDGKPVASNDSMEGRKLNRRVDVSFLPE